METPGYLNPQYVATLADFGQPYALANCRGSVLQRQIGETGYSDAMGPYPLFCCLDWSSIEKDLSALEGRLVSITLVTDPFGNFTKSQLSSTFPDLARPFKESFVADLTIPASSFVSSTHKRNARKALRSVEVLLAAPPSRYAETWCQLYESLKRRHGIEGISAFSPDSLTMQLELPGTVAFCAANEDGVVGMTIWYVHGNVGYYHLGAYSSAGYDLRASFAIFSHALEHFAATGVRWLNLGGAAGTGKADSNDGLARFKRGWSTGTRTMYLCGRILDPDAYGLLAGNTNKETDYFPAYRAGEFR